MKKLFKSKTIFFFGIIITILFLPQVSLAADYYVDQNNPSASDANAGTEAQPFKTIQKAANIAIAGDIVLVKNGIYDERITPINSGAAGSFISFESNGNVKARGFNVNNRNYIRIKGFEITNQNLSTDNSTASIFLEMSNNIEITNNYIHHTSNAYCIRMRDYDGPSKASHNNIIRDNIMAYCSSLNESGPGLGVNIFGNNNIVEGNDISHLGDDFIRITGGDFNVIRNNILHDNSLADWNGSTAHIDGIQNWCIAGSLLTRYLLIENNYMYNTPSPNTHFVIYQDYGLCGNLEYIIRYNSVKNLGSYVQINDEKTKNVRLYNNNFIDTGIAYNPTLMSSVEFTDNSSGGKVINNIFYNAVRDGYSPYTVDATSLPGFNAHNNLVYNAGYNGSWSSPVNMETEVILNSNPLFINSTDFNLQNNSPAINRGGFLATTTSVGSNSTALSVSDAGFFQDGWAGINNDWIAISNTINIARIESIDYIGNNIVLSSPLSWSINDPVWLYKNSFSNIILSGSAPDIGAYEYVEAAPPPDTTPPSAPSGLVVE